MSHHSHNSHFELQLQKIQSLDGFKYTSSYLVDYPKTDVYKHTLHPDLKGRDDKVSRVFDFNSLSTLSQTFPIKKNFKTTIGINVLNFLLFYKLRFLFHFVDSFKFTISL